jgi:hypothetical protein
MHIEEIESNIRAWKLIGAGGEHQAHALLESIGIDEAIEEYLSEF